MKRLITLFMFTLCTFIPPTFASEVDAGTYSTSIDFAQVTHVQATQKSNGSWCFDASVRHNDQGWEHYADGWEVIDLEGNQLGYRHLAHPHNDEQPFTRSQCGINIPEGTSKVIVRAKCNEHGFGGKPFVVELNNHPKIQSGIK